MYKIETVSNGRWVLLGGTYRSREEAEEAVQRFLDSTIGRTTPNGSLVQKRQYRIRMV